MPKEEQPHRTLDSEEAASLAELVTAIQSRDRSNQESRISPKTSLILPLGAIAGIITAIATPIWMISAYNSEFRLMKQHEVEMADNMSLNSRRIEWLRLNLGNNYNRWTWGMETQTIRDLCQKNTLKEPELKAIHESSLQAEFPVDTYPSK